MFFCELRELFVESLKTRVRNGEMSERGLARESGISQPHLHNVLKGTRLLSPESADKILSFLRVSVLDLVDRGGFPGQSGEMPGGEGGEHSTLPVVSGWLGPSHPWPDQISAHESFPVSYTAVRKMWLPVVVRLAFDVRMHPLFAEDDLALLDQSHRSRTEFDDDALYVIKRGRVGVVRRIRVVNRAVFMVAEDCLDRQSLWERLPVEGQQILHFVRAKATLVAREADWRPGYLA